MSFISAQMARNLGASGRIEETEDRAVTVRPSSTANFYIDSLDKNPTDGSGDFQITKKQALFNGFFHRIAVGEVVMDWGLPNVAQWWGNNFITVAVDSGGINGDLYTVTIPDGFYSVLDILDVIVSKLNSAPGQTATFSVGATGNQVSLGATQDFLVVWEQSSLAPTVPVGTAPTYDPAYALARALFSSSLLYTGATPVLTTNPLFTSTKLVLSPLLLGTRYVDIVSSQLTYNQELKDNTTATYQKDVLYRWYFAWDTNSGTDILTGTPTLYPYYILQGYKPFNQRRVLPYPKQIRWESRQPIGNVSFQSYDDRGRIIDTSKFSPSANYQFQMSMLLSEN